MLPGHPLRNRQKTLKLPPLVPPFSSKLVAMYNADVWVWPRQSLDLSPCKLLHEFSIWGYGERKAAVGGLRCAKETADRVVSLGHFHLL